MYENGKGTIRDYNRALSWYLKAAEAGNLSAMVSVGTMYVEGPGVKKDYPRAVTWFRKAADAGDPGGWAT